MNKSVKRVVDKVMGKIAPKKGYNLENKIGKQAKKLAKGAFIK